MTRQFDKKLLCVTKKLSRVTGLSLLLLLSPLSYSAEHGGGEKAAPPGAIYYNLYPPFVVSFKGEKRIRFLKVDITLRLQTNEAQEQTSRHMPRIRNDLIMLLSSQPEASLVTRVGKEKMRQDALKMIQDIVKNEEGEQGVIDLLFMNFVVQN